MAKIPVVVEVERVMNLVRGFGWEKTEEKLRDGNIVITIEKRVEEMGSPGPE